MAAGALLLAAVAAVAASLVRASSAQVYPFQNWKLSPESRAADLISRMTLYEKANVSVGDSPV